MSPLSSLILYTALTTNAPCETVFKEVVLNTNKSAESEMGFLDNFASVACKTDNPDLLWQLGYVESSFRFLIVNINKSGKSNSVLTGDDALTYLVRLKKSQINVNVDIGILQMNWKYHKTGYDRDPIKMLKPSNQVSYLVNKMVDPLVKKCGRNWIGCYHSWGNGTRSNQYRERVVISSEILKKQIAIYQRNNSNKDITKYNPAYKNNTVFNSLIHRFFPITDKSEH